MPFKSTNLLLSCWQTGLLERGCLLPSLQKAAQQDWGDDSHGGEGRNGAGMAGPAAEVPVPTQGGEISLLFWDTGNALWIEERPWLPTPSPATLRDPAPPKGEC